jgi:hypothetical protein
VLRRRVHFQRVQVAGGGTRGACLRNGSCAPSEKRVRGIPEAINQRGVATKLLLEGVTVEGVSATQPRSAQASASSLATWTDASYCAVRT